MYEQAKLAFEKYVNQFDKNNNNIMIKYRHTYQVVELMAELSFRFGFEKEDMELAKIIGLLHDIGRFEQIRKFDTMSDQASGMDHADYGVHYLIEEGHIEEFGIQKNTEIAKIIEKAIKNHNKLKIENDLTERELLFSKMIRDMDKIDIYRVIVVYFSEHQKFNADEVSKEVLKQFSLNQLVNHNALNTHSDMIIARLSFIFDINFDESFDILVDTDNFDLYLSIIEVTETSQKLWKKLREVCFDYINKGVGTSE